MWGKHIPLIDTHLGERYTPTCVGKTFGMFRQCPGLEVHPHVCGENAQRVNRFSLQPGTPPRVWGKLSNTVFYSCEPRYTPTCVGKTLWRGSRRLMRQVHPHVCGENCLCDFQPSLTDGTPPRVWGKRAYSTVPTASIRYTPTCVGKTNIVLLYYRVRQVHPHVCGENVCGGRI